MADFLDRCNAALADWLVRGRVWWFVIGLALVAVAFPLSRRVSYNRSMESFFPRADERLQLYQQNKQWFGGEHTLLVAYTDQALWTNEGMQRQQKLASALKGLSDQGVGGVVSLADRPNPLQPLETIGAALEKTTDPTKREQLKQQVLNTPLYNGVFVAKDEQTTALIVQLASKFDRPEDLDKCLEAVRSVAREQLKDAVARGEVTQPVVAGTQLLIHDVYEYTESDGLRLQVASVLLMGIVITLSFRSLRWVALPLLVIYSALYWSKGLWALVDGKMTAVGAAISSLVAVIGVATVVHFGIHFRELRQTHDTATSLRLTFLHMGPPIFWVLATTAGGFGALLVCELKPVLDFAWLMLIATFFVGIATMTFLPLGVMGFRTVAPRPQKSQELMARFLLRSLDWVKQRPWQTMLALIVPGVLIGLGVIWLKPQTDFTGNFRRDTEIFQAYDFIETNMGGAGQMDLVFNVGDLEKMPKGELDAFLKRLRTLEKELSNLEGVTKVLGLVDFLDFFDIGLGPGQFMRVRLLLLEGRVDQAKEELGLRALLIPKEVFNRFKEQPPITPLFWNHEAGVMRITLQVRERLPSEAKQELIAKTQEKAREVLGPEANPRATGIYVMLAHLIESLLNDQKLTFAVSLLCMFLMGLLAFRNFWLATITMIPTVLPVVAVVGTMGWVGLPVNIATAMLASVAMGMTIDSSLLYIYRFRQELQAGADFDTALTRTHSSTGIALIISNVALVLGFGALTLSRFIPLVHLGLLTGLALFGGLVGNLILLPLLLHLVPGLRRPQWPPVPERAQDSPAPAPVSRDGA